MGFPFKSRAVFYGYFNRSEAYAGCIFINFLTVCFKHGFNGIKVGIVAVPQKRIADFGAVFYNALFAKLNPALTRAFC